MRIDDFSHLRRASNPESGGGGIALSNRDSALKMFDLLLYITHVQLLCATANFDHRCHRIARRKPGVIIHLHLVRENSQFRF